MAPSECTNHGGGVEAGTQLTNHADHEHENTGVQDEVRRHLGATVFVRDLIFS